MQDFADELRRVIALATETPATRQILGGYSTSADPRTTPRATPHPSSRTASSRRRSREAERRQVTLLLCGSDLFASEAWREKLDAGQRAVVQRAFAQACEQVVNRFEGVAVESSERGFLGCFGFPVAFEDAAQRAARAGLELLPGLTPLSDQLRQDFGLEFHAWIGLHTGSVEIQEADDFISLAGETREVALHLAEAAAMGHVICTEATRRLVMGAFRCSSLGPRKLKGLPQAIELFQVEEAADAAASSDSVRQMTLTPLTGRNHELTLLRDRWEQARDGAGQVVLLFGEPGLGKSRLVLAIKEYVEEQSAGPSSPRSRRPAGDRPGAALSVVEWRCTPQFQGTGLYPAASFFERILAFGQTEPCASRFEKLVDHLGEFGLARPALVPLFARLLSLPLDERFPPLGYSPIREREETFRALGAWLSALAARRPILFICEDLHWADASTLEFLGSLIAEGLGERFLILLTSRPEFHPPWPAASHLTTLALSRLTAEQAREMIQRMAGKPLSGEMVEEVFDRAGGVPLYIEEFVKILPPEDGREKGGARGDDRLSREIPATLQDLIMARLDRVDGDREIAHLAAVLGREFNYDLLAAVARREAPVLEAEMRQLVHAEIIQQRGRPPHCIYIFKHALLQDALYNAMVKATRQELHRRVAEVLEAEFGLVLVETRPELLAYHFTEGGVPEKAVRYWLRAGLQSRERSAEVEAIGHLTRGRVLLKELPASPERDALELQLLGALGTAYIAARGYAAPEVGPVFERARELCARRGDAPQMFAMLLGIWEWHTVRANLRLCVDLAAQGMQSAGQRDDPGMMMEALFMEGETALYRGHFLDAYDSMENAVSNYDNRERTRHWATFTGHDAGITHRSNEAICMWHLGYPDQAWELNREMRKLAREIAHPFSVAYALHHTGWLALLSRLGAEMQSAGEEEMAIAAAQGFALWQATGTFFKGAGMFLQGQRDPGLALVLRGLAAFRATGAELFLPCQLGFVGEACTVVGRFRDARRALDEASELVEKNDERCEEAEIYRLKGELLLAESADPDPAAEGLFRQATAIAWRQQSKAFVLRSTMSLARLWQRQGRAAAAGEILAEAVQGYAEGRSTPDLQEAQALLGALSA
jgi:class 3 adenylate cyclase